MRSWYRVKRRETYIKSYDLAAWYKSTLQIENATHRDYLLLILFTGLRKNEAAQLKWENIDFKAKNLIVIDPKNHLDHVLPLLDFLYELLFKRSQVGLEVRSLIIRWGRLHAIRSVLGISDTILFFLALNI